MTVNIVQTRGTWKDREQLLRAIMFGQDFDTHGHLYARQHNPMPDMEFSMGKLPEKYHWDVLSSHYTIWSYSTPIAWWHKEDGWTVPEEYYSHTTSTHQGYVRTALIFAETWIDNEEKK